MYVRKYQANSTKPFRLMKLGFTVKPFTKPGFNVKPFAKLGFTVKPFTKLGFWEDPTLALIIVHLYIVLYSFLK